MATISQHSVNQFKFRRLQQLYGEWFYTTFGERLNGAYWGAFTGLDLGACDDTIFRSRDNESIEEAIAEQWGASAVQIVRILAGIDAPPRDDTPIRVGYPRLTPERPPRLEDFQSGEDWG